MNQSNVEILKEYGPFPGADQVHGVTFDGQNVWFASGESLNAFDPDTGTNMDSIDVAADAGTAFDGRHLFQLAEDRIQKIDPKSGRVLDFRHNPNGYAEIAVKTGGYVLTLQASADGDVEAVKPGVLSLANA